MTGAALATVSSPDLATFLVAAAIVLGGSLGVVFGRNPVHAALNLVMTLFGIAVLFVEEDAQFLAAVQIIVYTGAIVVLFLFVIMLLGVDRQERVLADQFRGQHLVALALGALVLAEVLLLGTGHWTTGAHATTGALNRPLSNVAQLGRAIFTTYLLPFEITSALLVVAVVAAVVLARRFDHAVDDEADPAEELAADSSGETEVPGR
jgi:NADH-quinone oxidoreductase subunit J